MVDPVALASITGILARIGSLRTVRTPVKWGSREDMDEAFRLFNSATAQARGYEFRTCCTACHFKVLHWMNARVQETRVPVKSFRKHWWQFWLPKRRLQYIAPSGTPRVVNLKFMART